ncbi:MULTISPECIES: hypothetical protein [unclassified Streptomyces]|uniref:hypothetical protein n=1 Tax=unclassified Streptomyces TaxID=2593676 RepID=UPI00093C7D00|nr:hypothetical protein [Streptomyces sp. CB01883]OKJ74321.1 hypothetical protein AMK32_35545 [Streptomyces sp. CB01883]
MSSRTSGLKVLFTQVCDTLARSGLDVASVGDGDGTGLRVRQEAEAVAVGWVPTAELDPVGRPDADFEGIRSALRQALLEILSQVGYVVQADPPRGEVRVLPDHDPGPLPAGE